MDYRLMALFAVIGLGLEVLFTAALDWNKDPKRLGLGHSSLWYVPLYASVPVLLSALWPLIGAQHWLFRGAVYMTLFFVVEYAAMRGLHVILGESPSEASYREARWNIHGFIRLDFAPAWFAAGLLFEYLFRRIIFLK